jgi:hypothetical protein
MRPLSAVKDAMQAGMTTAPAIAKHTGLSIGTVQAALEHLTRMGLVRNSNDTIACTECGMSCATSSNSCGKGLTTLTLLTHRPD